MSKKSTIPKSTKKKTKPNPKTKTKTKTKRVVKKYIPTNSNISNADALKMPYDVIDDGNGSVIEFDLFLRNMNSLYKTILNKVIEINEDGTILKKSNDVYNTDDYRAWIKTTSIYKKFRYKGVFGTLHQQVKTSAYNRYKLMFEAYKTLNENRAKEEVDARKEAQADGKYFHENQKKYRPLQLKKFIYGTRKEFKRYLGKEITPEDYKDLRFSPITITGCVARVGMEKSDNIFNFIDFDNYIIGWDKPKYYKNKGLGLGNMRLQLYPSDNYKKRLQEIKPHINPNDRTKYAPIPLSFVFKKKNVSILYPIDKRTPYKFSPIQENIVAGIDFNNKTLGFSIIDYNDVIPKYLVCIEYDFSELYEKTKGANGYSSDSDTQIKLNNKFKNSLLEIANNIARLLKGYNVSTLYLEKLKDVTKNKITKGGVSKNFGNISNKYERKIINRSNNTPLNLLMGTIHRCTSRNEIRTFEVNPACTTIIGNLKYNFVDSVNASIAIAEKGYYENKYNIKKYYPNINIDSITKPQWQIYIGCTENRGYDGWVDVKNAINKLVPGCKQCTSNGVKSKKENKKPKPCQEHTDMYRVKLTDPDIYPFDSYEMYGNTKNPSGVMIHKFDVKYVNNLLTSVNKYSAGEGLDEDFESSEIIDSVLVGNLKQPKLVQEIIENLGG